MGSDQALRRLPGYELLERVAVGGRGEIFLAREEAEHGRLVAVKLLRSEDLGRADRVQAFHDEVKVSTLLVHPNIVRVYHGDVAPDGVPFLVMEFVYGVTVWELLDRAKVAGSDVPLGVGAYITAMVAEALEHAHSLRGPDGVPLALVHRDVSTVNVMVTFDGAVKLLDFGIARSTIRQARTAPGIIKGKLDYLSPEQCTGGTIDALTDVYSLGVVLFELLTRQRPYQESDIGVLFDKVARGDRPRVHAIRPDLSPRLERIVDRAMAVNRSTRYGSAGEMLEDLRAAMRKLADVPTSTSLAALVARLAPDRVGAVQAAYGPPETTAVSDISKLGSGTWTGPVPPHEPASDDVPPPARVETPAPVEPPPPRAAPQIGGDRVLPARVPSRGVSQRTALFVLLALGAFAVLSGLVVTLAARGGGADEMGAGSAVAPVAPPGPPGTSIEWGAADPVPAPVPSPPGPGDGGPPSPGAVLAFSDAAPADPPGDAAPADPRRDIGYLTVETRRRAMVFLGPRRIGLTPAERLELEPGRYLVKVRNRHGVRRKRVVVKAGQETRVAFPL